MKTKLIIIGASGHGRVITDIARLLGYKKIEFLDDADNTAAPTVGVVADYERFVATHDFVVGIGNNAIRKRVMQRLIDGGANIVSLIHPRATIGSDVHIGKGTVVMAGAVINAGTVVGDGVIINTCSSVDHDCTIGDFAHISVGAHVAGTVTVGSGTMIGAGATVINNLSVCADCMIGAGAVVVKDIKAAGTYIGVPAERM